MEITDSSGTYSTIASAVTFVVLALITSTASQFRESKSYWTSCSIISGVPSLPLCS